MAGSGFGVRGAHAIPEPPWRGWVAGWLGTADSASMSDAAFPGESSEVVGAGTTSRSDAELPALYKINLKTGTQERAELIEYCLENRVLGMGFGAHYFRDDVPTDFADYYASAVAKWSKRDMGPALWFYEAEPGSLVWFRDLHGRYYLGRLAGSWRLLHGPAAERLDLANVRDVEYAPVGSEAGVPGAVIRGYAAPRQWTFSRVNDYGAQAYSALLASELLGGDPPGVGMSTREVLRSLLGPLDVEDLVAAFLQDTRDYIALPARHAGSTAVYEYVLKHRGDGHIAVVQVKTGGATVPLDTLDQGVAAKWFVYTDHDQELPAFVERIPEDALIAFMESRHPRFPRSRSCGCAVSTRHRPRRVRRQWRAPVLGVMPRHSVSATPRRFLRLFRYLRSR